MECIFLSLLENILVVTEFIPRGSLERLLKSKDERDKYANVNCVLNDRELLKIAHQIASGMQHLEDKKVRRGCIFFFVTKVFHNIVYTIIYYFDKIENNGITELLTYTISRLHGRKFV